MEIEKLVKSAVQGDQRAWRALVRRLGPRLQRWFAARYSRVDHRDASQETLIVVWAKLPNFELRSESEFMSWVLKIAQFKALAALRPPALPAPLTPTPTMGLSSRVDRAERVVLVRREIERLPESLRLAATNMLAGGDARELAEDVGLEWGTIRGYETQAIDRLRKRLRL